MIYTTTYNIIFVWEPREDISQPLIENGTSRHHPEAGDNHILCRRCPGACIQSFKGIANL
jgi:hypothetical protein